MNGNAFIVVAEELVDRAEESAYRTATSRAYYGAFDAARELLEEQLRARFLFRIPVRIIVL